MNYEGVVEEVSNEINQTFCCSNEIDIDQTFCSSNLDPLEILEYSETLEEAKKIRIKKIQKRIDQISSDTLLDQGVKFASMKKSHLLHLS
jgi:hypothetical protein